MMFVTTQHCDECAQCCTVGCERSSMIDHDKAYSEAVSVLQSDNTRVCLFDYATGIGSTKLHEFCDASWTATVAGDNSTSADERATESSATLLYMGDGGGSSSI
jgi:hypothetical protein